MKGRAFTLSDYKNYSVSIGLTNGVGYDKGSL